jgi:tRNA (guanine37-N1)-methyltransferase
MRIDILTLFPEMFEGVLGSSILKRAAEPVADPAAPDRIRPPVVRYHLTNIRDFSRDKHGKVDAPPYGGGPGMVMQCQPIWDAVQAVEAQAPSTKPHRIVLSPQGRRLTHGVVDALASQPRLLLIAGHYEGIDERLIEKLRETGGVDEISIGDYVLSGGELAAMVLVDAVVRLLPGVLGHEQSARTDSFCGVEALLDFPHFTRPRDWQGMAVPPVLLSGNHQEIAEWRRQQARRRTAQRRPDLCRDGGEAAPRPPDS